MDELIYWLTHQLGVYKAEVATTIVAIICIMLTRGYGAKKLFNQPVWSLYLGWDIGGNKSPKYISGYGINGAPDAVFFDLLLWY